MRGNTSTDVEKTSIQPSEYFRHQETPPRTWRRRGKRCLMDSSSRNTSTDVEKTRTMKACPGILLKHLHGRGEDLQASLASAFMSETPPRTWRRLRLTSASMHHLGNTSTDVEKTRARVCVPGFFWKHLHGRGEDALQPHRRQRKLETPPRTWRRPTADPLGTSLYGNTSTDVEKTNRLTI